MAVGYAGTQTPGDVLVNQAQSSADAGSANTTPPKAVTDDATTGTVVNHLGPGGPNNVAPTPSAGAGLGTGGSPAVTLVGGGDMAGQISIKGGTSGWATGAQGVLTFGTPFQNAPVSVVLTPANAASAAIMVALGVYPTVTKTALTINYGVADTAQHTYVFNYQVCGN
ncbi:MAG: hypothetical protein KGL39_35765 [Patescibacteria group bacterium]|nr:hypothetical protein [Patescibacteria group bacterium]